MARERFKLSCVASSRGSYVSRAHVRYYSDKQSHEQRMNILAKMLKPRYYVKCFGKLVQITDMEAAMLRPTMSVIVI